MEEDYEVNKQSSFNEASLKMKRLHESQVIINQLRTNLLAWNNEANKYNYEVVTSVLISLMSELRGKLKEDEKTIAYKWRELLIDYLELKPIYHTINKSIFIKDKETLIFNESNWRAFRKLLFLCEDFIKEMIEVHNLGSPNIEEEGGWD